MTTTNFWDRFGPTVVKLGSDTGVALLLLIVGWWLSNLLGKWVRDLAKRSSKVDLTVIPMFSAAIVWIVRILVLVAILDRFGVQTASILTVLGGSVLAIGLALQGTLQNIAAGIMLLVLRPIRLNEYVTLSTGAAGTVNEVGLFLTTVTTADGIIVTIPNSIVWNSTITNSSRNVVQRMNLPVDISLADDLPGAVACLMDVVNANPKVLATPAPEARVISYKPQAAVVNVRLWTATSDNWVVSCDLLQAFQVALKAAGFTVPVPTVSSSVPFDADWRQIGQGASKDAGKDAVAQDAAAKPAAGDISKA